MPASDEPRDRRLPPIRKNLGQHFLNDRRILERIVDGLQLNGTETVVEIGPGRGSLTDLLAPTCARLIAIEYDRALAAHLRARYSEMSNVEVVEADVLDVNLAELAGSAYRLVGNVPYYITTPILFHALASPRPDIAVYLVQREVAERIAAAPDTDAYGALSANVQAVAHAEMLFKVPAGAFHPPPKVDSAVVRLVPRDLPAIGAEHEEEFHRFVQAAFGLRRKQLTRVLRTVWNLDPDAAAAIVAQCGLDPAARPETLTPAAFAALLAAHRSGTTRDS